MAINIYVPSKLQLYGIHPKLVKWIESILTGRKQAVVVDGHLSFLALIISGVPQGTVLGVGTNIVSHFHKRH